ncbi:MAG TPA: hypothetical protein VFZ44_21210, partial [Pyrinomonadaceae bacterium]
RTKETLSLKEKEQSINERINAPAPFGLSPFPTPGDESAEPLNATGRAFIRDDERPEVGRRALELADEQFEPADDEAQTGKPEDVGKPVDAGKPGEASGKQAEAIN